MLSYTYAYPVLDEDLSELLITNATIDKLGIIAISFKKSLWRRISDLQNIARGSALR
jgi:hypothetical protein